MESRTLHGYAVFVGKTRRFHDSGLAVDESVKRAVDECIHEHILEDLRREEISRLIAVCKDLGVSREKTLEQLKKQYQLDTETAEQSLAECW